MLEQQLINYLYWLKERGQVFVSPLPEDSLETETEELAQTSSSTLISKRLLFISQKPLIDSELEMVKRIGSALGLKADEFQVIEEESLKNFSADFYIAMGDLNMTIPSSLAIPHPREMLANPQLKVSAWEKLQRVKSQLTELSR